MNVPIETLVDPDLYKDFVELSKDNIILQKALEKTQSVESFMNALMAASICLIDQHIEFQKMVAGVLKSNPQIKQILDVKNDPSLLSKNSEE